MLDYANVDAQYRKSKTLAKKFQRAGVTIMWYRKSPVIARVGFPLKA